MADSSRHDAWQAGDSYDAYMGRWSRRIAPLFLDWLDPPHGRDWLEIGCGTGALSAAILVRAEPRSLVSLDPSEGFVAQARRNVVDPRVDFRVGDAQQLDLDAASVDIVVSGLVLNFIPDRIKALAEMKRIVRTDGVIAFYVWDYAGRGVEFMSAFWRAASALDPSASDLTEDRRFPFCTRDGLVALAREAGLKDIAARAVECPTLFADFDDFWIPFTLGAGPAPGYCVKLEPAARERLRQKLERDLPRRPDGAIPLSARAWAVRARA